MDNELKPFDVQKEFADNGFTFFTKNLILCSDDTTENNAMTIGWGGIGNYLGHDRPASRNRVCCSSPIHMGVYGASQPFYNYGV